VTFLSPLFLLGAIAAGVPIVLHLLKREPEARIKFAAVKMLKHAPVEHTARHRLRELLLLALRVATLLLLALAFARPFILRGGAATVSGIRIVALDTSFSMSAPGRFAMAQQTARNAVSQAAIGELVGVVTFADDATIAATPSADQCSGHVNDRPGRSRLRRHPLPRGVVGGGAGARRSSRHHRRRHGSTRERLGRGRPRRRSGRNHRSHCRRRRRTGESRRGEHPFLG
jgi:hypothetical protein